jgi:hypothetical protein
MAKMAVTPKLSPKRASFEIGSCSYRSISAKDKRSAVGA